MQNYEKAYSPIEAFNATNSITRTIIVILLGLVAIGFLFPDPSTEPNIFSIIGTTIAIGIAAPECATYARDHNRSISWAYFIGGVFGIFGWLFYWLYVKYISKNN